jgi:hypothetical protein
VVWSHTPNSRQRFEDRRLPTADFSARQHRIPGRSVSGGGMRSERHRPDRPRIRILPNLSGFLTGHWPQSGLFS